MSSAGSAPAPRGDLFVTTRWSVVLSAGRKSSPHSERALAELCQTYWYPLYAFVRRKGHGKEDAEDLTQAFFETVLENNPLEGLTSERGRFRAFLLAAMKNFLANDWDRKNRQKRGGGALHLSLDWQDADARYHLEPEDPASPETLFDREWALALLRRVVDRLGEECAANGKAEFFDAVKELLVGGDAEGYGTIAGQLGMDAGAARVAVHRLRRRNRELLREEIAQTLDDPTRVDDELKALQAALSG
jgi:DNA-directed RNA polymerase specialized sigma24 family protein